MIGRRQRPARRLLSGAAASTVMGWGLYRYVDPWLFGEDRPVEPDPDPRQAASTQAA